VSTTHRLLVLLTVVLAGCLGAPGAPGATGTASDQPSATASPFADGTVSLPDGPKERPDRPDGLTRAAVTEYVETFEYRYAYNSLWYGEQSDVNLECDVDEAERQPGGWRVVVSCTGYSNTGGEATGTATATELHADWGTQTVVYRVGEDAVTRERDAGS
jgi:hypothetical protein